MQYIDQQQQDQLEARRMMMLEALGQAIAIKRREAVAGRTTSGIEDEWLGDEEFYQGYDDANRHEFAHLQRKPLATGGSSDPRPRTAGSTVFPNITQPYVDAAAARVGDMLLPTDDSNFAIDPTPIPDIADTLMQVDQQAATQMQQIIEKAKAKAKASAEKAQEQIEDWLVECQYHAELRKAIHDSARLGSGVMKGPEPVNRRSQQWRQGQDGTATLIIEERVAPASVRVDPWNFYPDPACGESIHHGAYVFERDYLTEKRLADLRGLPGYIDSQIDRVIDEGPNKPSEADPRMNADRTYQDQYEIWYYHGIVTRDELMAAGCECDEHQEAVPAILTLVNDRVIKAALSALDDEEFPYDVIPWKLRPGMPWGMGVSRQMRVAQRIVTGATRNMMDNAGLAAGPQIVLRRGIEPENNIWEVRPLKIWIEGDASDGQAGAPVASVVIPMLQVELNNIIQLGMKLAEDTTGLPMLMQGHQGKAPDTVGGMQILNNNANSVLRRVARLFDSCITEPHIRRYYAWLLKYGEDDSAKGDFQIVARGSTALVERDIQSQEMVQLIQLSLNPAFGIDPKRTVGEYLKSRRFDPAAFQYSDEEQQKMAQQQPVPAPQVQAAQIRAQVDLQKAKMDTDRDAVYVQAEMERTKAEHDARIQELQIKRELALLDYANKHQMSLEKVKADLTMESLRLQTQKQLSAASLALDADKTVAQHRMDLHKQRQVATAPTEPAGRAKPGRSFQS